MESSFLDLYTVLKIQERTLSKNQIDNYPSFTTFKYKEETGYQKRCIDYMFLADNKYYQKNNVVIEEYIDPKNLEDYG